MGKAHHWVLFPTAFLHTTSLVHLKLMPSSKDQILVANPFKHGPRLPSTEYCLKLHTEWLLRWTREVVTRHLHILYNYTVHATSFTFSPFSSVNTSVITQAYISHPAKCWQLLNWCIQFIEINMNYYPPEGRQFTEHREIIWTIATAF